MASTSSFYTSSGTSQTLERSVSDAAEDAEKLAINAEDSQFTLSDGSTVGFSALHHKAKAILAQTASETAKTASESARNTAETHKDDAQKLSLNAEDSQFTLADGSTTGFSALHYNAKALASKTAAATSATNAATSETNAATSEANAASSATTASTAATGAGTSETNAAASATSATASATSATSSATSATASASTATTKASEASTSASNAATSETNAASSATAGATSATNAATSETNAAASATTATTKATNAATSETNAATSATNAGTSATAAAASQVSAAASASAAALALDSFDDRYLGAKTGFGTAGTGPSLDNDSNALVSGALFFSSDANEMRVYEGASWIAASSAGGVSLLEFKYTATANQTTFTGSDDASNTLSYVAANLIVTLNGIVLENGADYTASNGSSVVLTSGAAANDELNIIAFKSFTTADMVSATNGGTFQANVGVTGNITVTGTVDGRDVATDGTKLDGIEASATADQTASEIKTAYESNSDTNAFTDALQTKLNGIEASADVTDATNVTSAGALMTSGGTLTGALNFGTSKWSIELDSGDNDLNFKYNGTTVFKLASNGAVTSANDVTAFGSP